MPQTVEPVQPAPERGQAGGNWRELPSLAFLVGVLLSAEIAALFLRTPEIRDFGSSFYPSARSWVETGRPFTNLGLPNLNPPSVTGLLFVPLSFLRLGAAAAVWTMVGALCLAITWRNMSRHLSLTRRMELGALGVLLCTLGAAGIVWLEGQITWVLLLTTTRRWREYRTGSFVRAGLWLSPTIAAKPFLALAALPLGALTCVTAALSSAILSIVSVAFTGIQPWREWVAAASSIDWLGSPGNASLWGLAARWIFPQSACPEELGASGLDSRS
jgi:hypothetical protein